MKAPTFTALLAVSLSSVNAELPAFCSEILPSELPVEQTDFQCVFCDEAPGQASFDTKILQFDIPAFVASFVDIPTDVTCQDSAFTGLCGLIPETATVPGFFRDTTVRPCDLAIETFKANGCACSDIPDGFPNGVIVETPMVMTTTTTTTTTTTPKPTTTTTTTTTTPKPTTTTTTTTTTPKPTTTTTTTTAPMMTTQPFIPPVPTLGGFGFGGFGSFGGLSELLATFDFSAFVADLLSRFGRN